MHSGHAWPLLVSHPYSNPYSYPYYATLPLKQAQAYAHSQRQANVRHIGDAADDLSCAGNPSRNPNPNPALAL